MEVLHEAVDEAVPEGWVVHSSSGQFTPANASETAALEGTFRYLYVMLPRADYLQLAEVEVHAADGG